MRQIAIYGKGGIGKSTISANLAAALAEKGKKVWYIGCDPKADGSMTLLRGRRPVTYLESTREGAPPFKVEVGFGGVRCVEIGGPLAGVGCAGRGIIVAVQALSRSHFTDDIDVILYDVPGDVVCGGFAVPIREKFANEVYIVSSGEYLSLYAANNIARGLKNLGVKLGGIICNSRETDQEESTVSEYATRIGSVMTAFIPRDGLVRSCENQGLTVIEGAPSSPMADAYRHLARCVLYNDRFTLPEPLPAEEIREMLREMSR
jgi:nitrogenase iron protein NifH